MFLTKSRIIKILAGIIFIASMVYVLHYLNGRAIESERLNRIAVLEKAKKDASRSPNYVALIIFSIVIQNNERTLMYINVRDTHLTPERKKFIDNSLGAKFPLFIQDGAVNARIIRLLNHEIICTPAGDTFISRYVPEVKKDTNTICTVAIPPSFGEFKGLVSILLSDPPNKLEEEVIKAILKNISADVATIITNP